ncbi:alpha-L-glutamate ligase-like protein [uncultured Abyssibacter sp.]|uniref:alpha-L-glutamate ligase-like protein n=1 Tax=uncultured Abyssibacter sp. TaxID=2320202 RepID=UPI0032B1CD82
MRWPGTILREAGILSMNQRNADYIMLNNKRRLYPLVDDKLKTKELAQQAGIAVPELYGVVKTEHAIGDLEDLLGEHRSFVVKPAHGSGGNGILVITDRRQSRYVKASGSMMSADDLNHHISNILSGMFSLGGMPDHAMVEYCVQFDPIFEDVAFQGVPDIRTIVFRGVPVASMVRLPTRASDGKANLHQGAVGAGIDMATGLTQSGVCQNARVTTHPDTGAPLAGISIPGWDKLLLLAARCYDLAALGYLGVDVVLDREHGPLVLELNARPGLSIQLANRRGLLPALKAIERMKTIPTSADERVALGLDLLVRHAPS